jgi:hypothetical protein
MEAGHLAFSMLIFPIAVALLFDVMNGLHDAANSIATIVSTNVLSPKTAVIWAAVFNFVAFLVFGLQVAKTMGTGIVSENAGYSAPLPGTLSLGGRGCRRAARTRSSAASSAPAWPRQAATPSSGAVS